MEEVETVDRGENGQSRTTTYSRGIQFALDPSHLSLIESEGELFLDRGGSQVAERGASRRATQIAAFDDSAGKESGKGAPAMALSGWLEVEYDEGTLILFMVDNDSTGHTFELVAPIYIREAKDAQDDQSTVRTQPQSDDGVIGIVADDGGSSFCTITCNNGDSSINCYNVGCTCWCSGGNPRCSCNKTSGGEQ